jgi:hypothetical protein
MSSSLGFPPMHLVAAEVASLVDQQREEAEQEQRQAAASEADRQRQVRAGAAFYETATPPSATDLEISVEGLPPARAAMVRLFAWIAALQLQLSQTIKGRAAFIETLGIASITQQALDDLVAADKTNLLSWMKAGAGFSMPVAREFERQQLAAKLDDDRYQTVIAREAITLADLEIDTLMAGINLLQKRRRSFVLDAVLEYATEGAARAYIKAIADLETSMAALLGLAGVVGRHGGFYVSYADKIEADITLPAFSLPGIPGHIGATMSLVYKGAPSVCVTEHTAKVAAEPWRRLVDLWTMNPEAEPPQKD